MPRNAGHAELLRVLEMRMSCEIVSPHVVVGRLLVESLQAIRESPDFGNVLREASDVSAFLVLVPNHRIDIDVICHRTHPLPGLRQLQFVFSSEYRNEGLRRSVADNVVPFEDQRVQGFQVAIRLGQFSDEGVARQRIEAEHHHIEFQGFRRNFLPGRLRLRGRIVFHRCDEAVPSGNIDGLEKVIERINVNLWFLTTQLTADRSSFRISLVQNHSTREYKSHSTRRLLSTRNRDLLSL